MSEPLHIGGVALEELEEQILVKLLELARQGNAAAANNVHKMVEQVRAQRAHLTHQARLADCDSDIDKLCHYFGELGLTFQQAQAHLGRPLTEAEMPAFYAGHAQRELEARALQRARARQGTAALPGWMTKHGSEDV